MLVFHGWVSGYLMRKSSGNKTDCRFCMSHRTQHTCTAKGTNSLLCTNKTHSSACTAEVFTLYFTVDVNFNSSAPLLYASAHFLIITWDEQYNSNSSISWGRVAMMCQTLSSQPTTKEPVSMCAGVTRGHQRTHIPSCNTVTLGQMWSPVWCR